MEIELQGSTCLIGDIHGHYISDFFRNFEGCNPSNSELFRKGEKIADNYIFLGDIGFGFDRVKTFCNRLEKAIPLGVQAYFIRGNHDNPSCWKGWKKGKIQMFHPRFHMVGDYDVLIIYGKKYLCIGGGISIDRHYRIPGISYWEDEHILPPPKQNTFGEIYGVLSHTGFSPPILTHKQALMDEFPDVRKDCDNEQVVLSEILNLYNLQVWFNGHYHVHCKFKMENCLVTALNINEHHLVLG